MKSSLTLILIGLVALIAVSCGGPNLDDPKSVVNALFGAMEKNDPAALTRILDIGELMKNTDSDYALQTDNPRVFTTPQDILDDLTNDGQTKATWFKYQRIVNPPQVTGNSATVEVTFVDKEASKGFRTQFGLHKTNGQWRIYSFKTVEDPASETETEDETF